MLCIFSPIFLLALSLYCLFFFLLHCLVLDSRPTAKKKVFNYTFERGVNLMLLKCLGEKKEDRNRFHFWKYEAKANPRECALHCGSKHTFWQAKTPCLLAIGNNWVSPVLLACVEAPHRPGHNCCEQGRGRGKGAPQRRGCCPYHPLVYPAPLTPILYSLYSTGARALAIISIDFHHHWVAKNLWTRCGAIFIPAVCPGVFWPVCGWSSISSHFALERQQS